MEIIISEHIPELEKEIRRVEEIYSTALELCVLKKIEKQPPMMEEVKARLERAHEALNGKDPVAMQRSIIELKHVEGQWNTSAEAVG